MASSLSPFKWLFVSESKGIQQYILRTGRLQHMVGASTLVDNLPKVFLPFCLEKIGISHNDYLFITQAAGRASLLLRDENQAKTLYAIWPFLAEQYAPGLEIVQALVEIQQAGLAEALDIAREEIRKNRQRITPDLPVAGPLVERCRRDGLPSVATSSKDGPISREILRKLSVQEQNTPSNKLIDQLLGDNKNILANAIWPSDITNIADSENSYIAIVHADANGMGNLISELSKKLPKNTYEAASILHDFSNIIQKSSERAAQIALNKIIPHIQSKHQDNNDDTPLFIPLRPLVFAGDDLTIVISASLAALFTKTYLEFFEKFTYEGLLEILQKFNIPARGLTASAGIVFVKKNFPFRLAYSLCESLCALGKEQTQRKASSLTIWRQTSSIVRDIREHIEQELVIPSHDNKAYLTMGSYIVGDIDDSTGRPRFSDLMELKESMLKIHRNSLRALLAECYQEREIADQAFERFRDVYKSNPDPHHRKIFESFEHSLIKLTKNPDSPLWTSCKNNSPPSTPLLDAIDLITVNSILGE